ncbi:hypothetical protein BgiMline_020999 [Biomphalaria glabrata]|nr:hypothetical protein BgiMline_018163 [Biomphalaria glabrata]
MSKATDKLEVNVPDSHKNKASNDFDRIFGNHETMVSDGSEADLHQEFYCCEKNPGHPDFIPIKTFSIEHIPQRHQDRDLYDFITSIADMTVRVDVKLTSQNRPMFWPRTDVKYPFYEMKDINAGKNRRLGSGRVSLVTKYVDGYDADGYKNLMSFNVCPCHTCRESVNASTVWWDIEILTATHVVFDDLEAAQTTCRLFYDDKDCPVVTIDGVCVGFQNIERDWCRLVCVTCNKELGDKLSQMKKRCNTLWKVVHPKYYDSKKDEHKLMFIVSHPHGRPKYVSIGQWEDRIHLKNFIFNGNQFSYKTSTCPGSSGATVYCLGYTGWWLFQLVHSGSKSELNYCSPGFVL